MQNSRPLRVDGEMWPYPEMIETVRQNSIKSYYLRVGMFKRLKLHVVFT